MLEEIRSYQALLLWPAGMCSTVYYFFLFFLQFILLVMDCSSYNLFYLYVSCVAEAWPISLTSPLVLFPVLFSVVSINRNYIKSHIFLFFFAHQIIEYQSLCRDAASWCLGPLRTCSVVPLWASFLLSAKFMIVLAKHLYRLRFFKLLTCTWSINCISGLCLL